MAQPVHFSVCTAIAGKNPLLLNRFLIEITPAGHVSTQKAQPLHSSVLIFILPFI
jgi:hypothetical protein